MSDDAIIYGAVGASVAFAGVTAYGSYRHYVRQPSRSPRAQTAFSVVVAMLTFVVVGFCALTAASLITGRFFPHD